MANQTITIALNKKVSLTITSANEAFSLDSPIYAINWFNLKSEWLYDFYNLLAYPHVRTVKGKGVFKGKMLEKWEGEKQFDRNFLLIVGYPKVDNFLQMVSNKIFLLKSLVRLATVKDFIFGFTHRFDENESTAKIGRKYKGSDKYMVHIFQNKNDTTSIDYDMLRKLATNNTRLYYGGLKAAYVGKSENNGELKNNPFFVDGILVWSAAKRQHLSAMMNSDSYKQFKEEREYNNIYLFKRLR